VSDDDSRPTAFTSADPPRNFKLTTEERIRALTIGPPAYAVRKKHIEDLLDAYTAALVAAHAKWRAAGGTGDPRPALLLRARAIDLKKLTSLVSAHNRYYPIEANLPCHPQTGAFMIYGRAWEPEPTPSHERLVELATAAIR